MPEKPIQAYRIDVESTGRIVNPDLNRITNSVTLEKPNGAVVKRTLPVVDWTSEMMYLSEPLANETRRKMASDIKASIITLGVEIPSDADVILSPAAKRVLMFDEFWG